MIRFCIHFNKNSFRLSSLSFLIEKYIEEKYLCTFAAFILVRKSWFFKKLYSIVGIQSSIGYVSFRYTIYLFNILYLTKWPPSDSGNCHHANLLQYYWLYSSSLFYWFPYPFLLWIKVLGDFWYDKLCTSSIST